MSETIGETQIQSDESPEIPQAQQSQPESITTVPNQPLSKKALKRQLKAERFAEYKLEKRAREKEKKKEKKEQLRLKRAAGEELEEEDVPSKKRPKVSGPPFEGRVVVDLDFDDKMTDKEIVSLCSQLAYVYSSNRKAMQPFSSLLFTSLNGRTLTRLESQADASYKRWTGTKWWSEGYQNLWSTSTSDDAAEGEERCSKETVVYLTADAHDELTELKANETYIIGGICDHNRYKNLCENKAKADGIRSAKLPIGTFIAQMPSRKVLTVNQAFDILLQWVEHRDWEKAFYTVIPKRKFHGAGIKQKQGDENEVDEVESKDPQADS